MKVNKALISIGVSLIAILGIILVDTDYLRAAGDDPDYYDDFERADVIGSIWDSVELSSGNSATIDSSVFYSGSRSLKLTFNSASNAFLRRDISATNPTAVNLGFRFRMDSTLLNDGDPIYLAALRDEAGVAFVYFYYMIDGENRYLQIDYRKPDVSGERTWKYGQGTYTYLLAPDVWYHLQIQANVAGTESIAWSINGQTICNIADDFIATEISTLDVGVVDSEYISTGSLYLDDIHWNNSTVDCEALDRGRVSFTFDDGLISNYTILKPILDQYGFKASFYIVTEYQVDKAAYAMTVPNLTELKAQGHQIQSHSYDHINLTTLSQADRLVSLATSKSLLEGWGFDTFLFTLPFGAYNDDVLLDTLSAGYSLMSTTDEGYNNIVAVTAKTRIMRIDADLYTPAELNAMIDAAMAKNLWIVLYYHKITGSGPGEVDGDENHTPDEIRAVFDHVENSGYDVALQEAMNSYPSTNSAPTTGSVTPDSGTTSEETFTATYSDVDGHYDLGNLYFLINDTSSTTDAAYVRYDVGLNLLYLRDDDDMAWGTGRTPGSASVLSNSQVSIDLTSVSFSKNSSNGSDVSLVLPMSFALSFAGNQNIYLRSEDVHGATSSLTLEGSIYTAVCIKTYDVNLDGSVTPGDALLILNHYLGNEIITDDCSYTRADTNGDGSITPGDALIVLQAYLGAS